MKWLEKYNISNKDVLVMVLLVIAQAVTAIWAKNDMISFISGMAGIISVVLCSQKKLTFYLFGFIQLGTYLAIVTREHIWGEFIENIFYGITMIIGVFIWLNNYNEEKYEVNPKELDENWKLSCFLIFIIGTIISCFVLLCYTNDPYPFWDSISTIPAFIAEILMICGYKEQWKYWLIVDLTSIVLWSLIGNPFMIVQYILWSINCLYGMYKWKDTKVLY